MLNSRFAGLFGKYYTMWFAITVSGLMVVIVPASGRAQVVATAPYSVTTFATAPEGLSAPDSITFSATNVFVGYGNEGAPDGSDGAVSNIIEYDFHGNTVKTFPTIVGHNDGLRYNPLTNELWALQNEDGNANLDIINLKTFKQTIYLVGPTGTGPHGGGYDDLDFNNKQVYVSASAPTIDPNTAPAIVTLKLIGKKTILNGILNGNATVTDVTTGSSATLNLQDPDSMILNPQGDGELIIVQHPGLSCQKAFRVPVSLTDGGATLGNTQLDDTIFADRSAGVLLVEDKELNAVYAISAPYFGPAAYSAVSVYETPTAVNPLESFVGQTNLTTGFVTPIVNGMEDPGGMAFIPSGVDLAKYVQDSVQIPENCPAS
ncbi:MAG TPA: hypothetical protein VMU41_06330 [Candidatus Binataceae bacterium]|nr:hypothetical protein [Candidatus Binataceae bacterium]